MLALQVISCMKSVIWMKGLVIFIHGHTGNGQNWWFPELHKVVRDRGMEVISPSLPNSDTPVYEEWKATLLTEIAEKWRDDAPIFLLGFSLGGFTSLALLSDCKSEPWVAHVTHVMWVAPVTNRYDPTAEFISHPVDWQFIHDMNASKSLIYSVDDSALDQSNFTLLKEKLGNTPSFTFQECKSGLHFTSGYQGTSVQDFFRSVFSKF